MTAPRLKLEIVRCVPCCGSGWVFVPNGEIQECGECEGTGENADRDACFWCEGTGQSKCGEQAICDACRGVGYRTVTWELT